MRSVHYAIKRPMATAPIRAAEAAPPVTCGAAPCRLGVLVGPAEAATSTQDVVVMVVVPPPERVVVKVCRTGVEVLFSVELNEDDALVVDVAEEVTGEDVELGVVTGGVVEGVLDGVLDGVVGVGVLDVEVSGGGCGVLLLLGVVVSVSVVVLVRVTVDPGGAVGDTLLV